MIFFCFPFLPFCTIPYKLCNKKAQICCLISMETTIFATVLRYSEVSLHILVQKGACMPFPCFTVGLSRFTVWMKVKRPSYVLTMNGAIVRFHRFFYSSSIFIIQCAKIIILKSVIQNDIV